MSWIISRNHCDIKQTFLGLEYEPDLKSHSSDFYSALQQHSSAKPHVWVHCCGVFVPQSSPARQTVERRVLLMQVDLFSLSGSGWLLHSSALLNCCLWRWKKRGITSFVLDQLLSRQNRKCKSLGPLYVMWRKHDYQSLMKSRKEFLVNEYEDVFLM